MKSSRRTKRLRLITWILTALSTLLSIGPVAVYAVIAFKNSQVSPANKCILLSMISIGVILSLMALITKYTPRCRMWLIIIGLYLCLEHILGTILVIAITQVLDELVISPMARSFRAKLLINKEYDKRQ